ncbi:MAG: hypothetical protein WCT49_00780 [Candidatus Paceibacterota bacterium]|jgi:hypothetical protein|nr:hypothetical protein [Candidatus Paceibacterota bacterium]
MKKTLIIVSVIIAILGIAYFFTNPAFIKKSNEEKQTPSVAADKHMDGEYIIEGKKVKLVNGFAEEKVSGSDLKMFTYYFGNELKTDLDADGAKDDIVFLITQDRGEPAPGTFFYVVGAVNTDRGYVGTDGYLLGDRIAPQTTEESKNPKHKNVVVVNYADRAPGESVMAWPSVGKSAYLKLDVATMKWGIVIPDFEGESR